MAREKPVFRYDPETMKPDTCPVCGYKSVSEEYDICDICLWEHDFVQEFDVDDAGGPNRVSLRQAQKNFRTIGVSDPVLRRNTRPPRPDDKRDPDWKPVDPPEDAGEK